MTLKGVSCIRGEIPMEEHLRCMLNEAPCGIPPTVLEVMVRPPVDREGVVYSPSSIQGCHRQFALKQKHEWYIPVDSVWPISRGTIFHHGMALLPAPEGTLGVIRELRMFAPIQTRYGEQQFSGQIDEILLTHVDEGGLLHVRLTDWKTKGDIPHAMLEPDKRHLYQINYYRWLVEVALKEYLDHWDEWKASGKINPSALLSLRGTLRWGEASFRSVVVDELQVSYLGGNKIRTFTTSRLLSVRGKLKGEIGADKKWHRYIPREYEELELQPMRFFRFDFVEDLIRKGIEDQAASQTQLAEPLVGEDAALMCPGCPVRKMCVEIGCSEGYDMSAQEGDCNELTL